MEIGIYPSHWPGKSLVLDHGFFEPWGDDNSLHPFKKYSLKTKKTENIHQQIKMETKNFC